MMEYYKIEVLSGEEITDLISDLLELALELSLHGTDVRPLIKVAQILHKAEPIEEEGQRT